ncbi:MAG: 2-phospho-L-lactate transferase [Actinomycetota bacterium]|nr:2-phospho-L-lactate transferase [Actinomycetota bacterium]
MTELVGKRIVVLCGGVGAAKLLQGLVKVVAPNSVTAIVNTGDDLSLHGLHICPDIDTVIYTLGNEINPDTGWGLRDEGWRAMDMLAMYGGIDWFRLGDRDIGTHLFRTQRLSEGATLSEVTREIAAKWEVGVNVIPMSNDPVRTIVSTVSGEDLNFQDYFVRLAHDVEIASIKFQGHETAHPAPELISEILEADIILVAPSNPLVSIAPILSIAGIRDVLQKRRKDVIAISGIIGGKALKGPAGRLLNELGYEASAAAVAEIYKDIAGTFVIDDVDKHEQKRIQELGLNCIITDTVMTDSAKAADLCRTIFEKIAG